MDDGVDHDKLQLINKKDLEWLAWNWRLVYNQTLFKTKRDIIYGHLNEDVPLLPTPAMILDGIVKAQMDMYANLPEKSRFIDIINYQNKMWKKIFSLSKRDLDLNEPLTEKVLSNPGHDFVKLILYMYSMESFIFREMNKASRLKDVQKIKYYGPFASALGFIVHSGNHRGPKMKKAMKK